MASKYDAINKIKAKNPELTWTEAARKAGFMGEFTSYKGKAKPRTGDPRGQARRRANFDQPSTELAGYKAKQLKQESADINVQAGMYGLEPTQIEHLADQADIQNLTSGSGGDPTNLALVTQSEARFKDRVKQIAGDKYGVTVNPTADSIKVIPKKYFDPIADPSTLPGIDIPVGTPIEDIENMVTQGTKGPLVIKGGTVKFSGAARRATKLLPIVPAVLGVGEAFSQAKAGDLKAAQATIAETAVSEVPGVGDLFVADPLASGTIEGAQQEAVRAQQPKSAAAKFIDDPLNELEYAGKQIMGGLKAIGGGIVFGF